MRHTSVKVARQITRCIKFRGNAAAPSTSFSSSKLSGYDVPRHSRGSRSTEAAVHPSATSRTSADRLVKVLRAPTDRLRGDKNFRAFRGSVAKLQFALSDGRSALFNNYSGG